MAKKQPKTAAEEAVVKTDEAVVIDDTVPEALQNPLEVRDRVNMLVEGKVLVALSASIPKVQEGSAGDVKIFARFIDGVRNGIDAACRAILSVSDSVSGITNAVKTASFDLGNFQHLDTKGHSQQVIAAIREASGALRLCLAEFIIDDLADEDALLAQVLEKKLAVESFLVLPKAQLVFADKEEARVPVASFFKSPTTKIETAEEEEKVPELQWSWTDQELFGEQQIPQIQLITIKAEEVRVAKEKFTKDIFREYEAWKDTAVSNFPGVLLHDKKTGQSVSQDEFMSRIEDQYQKAIKYVFSLMDGLINSISHHHQTNFQDLQRDFEREFQKIFTVSQYVFEGKTTALEHIFADLFTVFQNSAPVDIPYIDSQHFISDGPRYVRRYKQVILPVEVLMKCIEEGVILQEQKITVPVANHKTSRLEKGAMRQCRNALTSELELCMRNVSDEARTCTSAMQFIELMRNILHSALHSISTFTFEGLHPSLLAHVKNTASFLVCRNIRMFTILDSFMFADYESNDDFIQIMNNFYPQPPPAAPKKVVKKISNKEAEETPTLSKASLLKTWGTIRDEALAQLSLRKAGKDAEVDKRILDELIVPDVEGEIFECIGRINGLELHKEDDAKRYLAAFQSIIDAVPKEMTVGKDTIAVPAAFREHLQSRLDELSHYILSHCTGNVSSHGDAVKTRVKFANPFAGIMENAKKRRDAREAGAGSSADAGTKKSESVRSVLEELYEVKSHAQLVELVSRAAASRIADAASVVIGSHAGGMDAEAIRNLSGDLQGLIDAGTAGAKEALSTADLASLTSEQISSAVDAAFGAALQSATSLPFGLVEAMTTALDDQKTLLGEAATGPYDIAGYIDVASEKGTTMFTRNVDIMISARQSAADRHHNQQVNQAETEVFHSNQQLEFLGRMFAEKARHGESPEIRAAGLVELQRLDGFLKGFLGMYPLDSEASDHE